MEYSNKPLTYAGQIGKLKNDGLIIENDKETIAQLNLISYSRLDAYLRPTLKDKDKHKFKPNSSFNNAMNLYCFDKELRTLLFTAIQDIELPCVQNNDWYRFKTWRFLVFQHKFVQR